jgi:transposase
MELVLTTDGREALERGVASESRTRQWKRYRAVLLLADGMSAAAVATALDCARSSVYGWAHAWRARGVDGLREGPHQGAARLLDAAGEVILEALLAENPQTRGHHATGWTVSLVQGELAAVGYRLSDRTLRRALHRLGYRWKRPKFVLGRPDPAYDQKKGTSPSARS